MKTVEKTIYRFKELSENAKDNFRYETEYFWAPEAMDALKAFMNHLGLKIKNYSIDWLNSHTSYVEYFGEINGEVIPEDLTGYCWDYPLRKTYNETRDVDCAVSAWLKYCENDYAYLISNEALTEHCDSNDYWFNEDGSLY